MITPRHHRPAFAALTAIFALAAVGVAVAILAGLMAMENRRTHEQVTGAQLRQLLLAGTAAAQGQLNQSTAPIAPWNAALPPALADRGASVRITLEPAVEADRRQANITARCADRWAEQTVLLARAPGGWEVRDARLLRANAPAPRATAPPVAATRPEAPLEAPAPR
jgi:hypothetical protein